MKSFYPQVRLISMKFLKIKISQVPLKYFLSLKVSFSKSGCSMQKTSSFASTEKIRAQRVFKTEKTQPFFFEVVTHSLSLQTTPYIWVYLYVHSPHFIVVANWHPIALCNFMHPMHCTRNYTVTKLRSVMFDPPTSNKALHTSNPRTFTVYEIGFTFL